VTTTNDIVAVADNFIDDIVAQFGGCNGVVIGGGVLCAIVVMAFNS
jgi:hypothetical protein